MSVITFYGYFQNILYFYDITYLYTQTNKMVLNIKNIEKVGRFHTMKIQRSNYYCVCFHWVFWYIVLVRVMLFGFCFPSFSLKSRLLYVSWSQKSYTDLVTVKLFLPWISIRFNKAKFTKCGVVDLCHYARNVS